MRLTAGIQIADKRIVLDAAIFSIKSNAAIFESLEVACVAIETFSVLRRKCAPTLSPHRWLMVVGCYQTQISDETSIFFSPSSAPS